MITGIHGIVYARDDRGFGLMTSLWIPGGGEMRLYEPKHPSPLA